YGPQVLAAAPRESRAPPRRGGGRQARRQRRNGGSRGPWTHATHPAPPISGCGWSGPPGGRSVKRVTTTPTQRRVLLVAILASFVSFLDGTVVNVALPAIADELGGPGEAGLTLQQWVVDGYLVTLGALILAAGSLSDVHGRRQVLLDGLLGFAVASVL